MSKSTFWTKTTFLGLVCNFLTLGNFDGGHFDPHFGSDFSRIFHSKKNLFFTFIYTLVFCTHWRRTWNSSSIDDDQWGTDFKAGVDFFWWSQCLKIIQNVAFLNFGIFDHFWHFEATFVHSKCKDSSLRTQCWNRLFRRFLNTLMHTVRFYQKYCHFWNCASVASSWTFFKCFIHFPKLDIYQKNLVKQNQS